MPDSSETQQYPAVVSAAFGRRMELELADGRRVPARTRRRALRPVCGDNVLASSQGDDEDWLVDTVEPRQTELARTDQRGRRELLAANVTVLVVVIAPAPQPDWFVVDRFLGAAHLDGMAPLLVLNKAELVDELPAEVNVYDRLGYERIESDAHSGLGIDALAVRLHDDVAAFVGQSGVGKSSLSNALVPDAELAIGAINESRDEGRHTTVAARRLRLPHGGALIDSPGVRDFAPHIDNVRDVAIAFPELQETGQHCRFADCAHRVEPGCAVRAAVETGVIDARRYASYLRLRNITRDTNR